jgi:predicted RNase H-like HicB family nuclease
MVETMTYADMHLTIRYESGEDGWTIASIPEIPGAVSQGRTRDEAREMVIDALRTLLSSDAGSDRGDIEELPFALSI